MSARIDVEYSYLSGEGDRWLIQTFLLRIANVGGDNLVKRQTMVGLLELIPEQLCLDGELASDSILNLFKGRIERVD